MNFIVLANRDVRGIALPWSLCTRFVACVNQKRGKVIDAVGPQCTT
jgi:hypothetical protein